MLNRTQQIGFTLPELMITAAIPGVLTALAAQSLTSTLERRKIMHNQQEYNTGFTLIEVLIAMLMLAVGLIGLAGLQATRPRNNQRACNRSQATQFPCDLADRMHTNVAGVATYNAMLPGAAVKETSIRCKTFNSLGFTLVELMITVAIVAILLGLAVPSFQDMLRQNRAVSLVNELAASLNLARSEAIKRGTRVSVCKSANITDSSPTCSTTANWQDGWLVFVDNKGTSGTFDYNIDPLLSDTQLKVGQPSNSNAVISAGSTFSNYVSYLPSGSSPSNGTLDICVGSVKRSIIIITTGRIRFSKGTCP